MSAASVFQKMGPILSAASGLSERVRRLGGRECEQGSRIKVLNMEGGGGMRAESKWKKVGSKKKKKVVVEEKKEEMYSTGHTGSDGLQRGHFLLCCRWMKLQVLPPSTAPSPLPHPPPLLLLLLRKHGGGAVERRCQTNGLPCCSASTTVCLFHLFLVRLVSLDRECVGARWGHS